MKVIDFVIVDKNIDPLKAQQQILSSFIKFNHDPTDPTK